ncbi:MAG: acyltransferase [Candidatus Aminicenantes bacterium]|jgi:acetyltransferase-like isoleucine patch superfamily enzyme
MGIGFRKNINKLYIVCLKANFKTREIFLGFENANIFLVHVDKRALIPILRSNGAVIGDSCDIESGIIFHNCKDKFKNLAIGNNCHIGKNCFLDLKDEIVIKDNVTVSMGSKILTHLDMGKSGLSKKYPPVQKSVVINNNCFIGTGVAVLMGVELGENCVVTAGSIVTKSFPANSLIAGVPGKLVKSLSYCY